MSLARELTSAQPVDAVRSADLLVEGLKVLGVPYAFGVPGAKVDRGLRRLRRRWAEAGHLPARAERGVHGGRRRPADGQVSTRTVMAQHKPYPPMAKATVGEPITSFGDLGGDLVGFRTPSFQQGLSVAGYHLHFLDETGRHGGHALDVDVADVEVSVCTSSELVLSLPRTPEFLAADLSGRDVDEQIRATEGG